MSDWLYTAAILATVIFGIIIIIIYIFTRVIKPVPKPIIKLNEIQDPLDPTGVSRTIRFVLYSNVNKPSIVQYPVTFELFDSPNGKENTIIGPLEEITQTKPITKNDPGIWEFDNFIENKRIESSYMIEQMLIRIKQKDSSGKKYCYCGFFKYNRDNGTWNAVNGYEFYVRYKRLKCLFCVFKD
jgi:hypothetical protein